MSQTLGTTRNITEKFLKYRKEYVGSRLQDKSQDDDNVHAKLLDSVLSDEQIRNQGGGDIEMGIVHVMKNQQPQWMKKTHKIKEELIDLKKKLQELRQWHNKALLVTFDSENDPKVQVEEVTSTIKNMLRNINREIESLNGLVVEQDAQIIKGAQRQLASQLLKFSIEFRQEKMKFLNKIEQESGLRKGYFGLDSDVAPSNIADPLSIQLQQDKGFTQQQLEKLDQSDAVAKEREEEIRNILETISELFSIMKDLSILVVEQGTILDRIDYQVQTTVVKVNEGVKHLEKAESIQKNSCFLYTLLCLVVGIIILVVIIIIRRSIS